MLALIFSACGNDEKSASGDQKDKKEKNQANKDKEEINEAALIGKWMNKESNSGFDIQAGGKISSINMATLDYNSWKLEGNKLTLNSTSKGVSNPGTVDEVYTIKSLREKRLALAPSNDPKARLIYEKN